MDWGGRLDDEEDAFLRGPAVTPLWFRILIAGWIVAAVVGLLQFGVMLAQALSHEP